MTEILPRTPEDKTPQTEDDLVSSVLNSINLRPAQGNLSPEHLPDYDPDPSDPDTGIPWELQEEIANRHSSNKPENEADTPNPTEEDSDKKWTRRKVLSIGFLATCVVGGGVIARLDDSVKASRHTSTPQLDLSTAPNSPEQTYEPLSSPQEALLNSDYVTSLSAENQKSLKSLLEIPVDSPSNDYFGKAPQWESTKQVLLEAVVGQYRDETLHKMTDRYPIMNSEQLEKFEQNATMKPSVDVGYSLPQIIDHNALVFNVAQTIVEKYKVSSYKDEAISIAQKLLDACVLSSKSFIQAPDRSVATSYRDELIKMIQYSTSAWAGESEGAPSMTLQNFIQPSSTRDDLEPIGQIPLYYDNDNPLFPDQKRIEGTSIFYNKAVTSQRTEPVKDDLPANDNGQDDQPSKATTIIYVPCAISTNDGAEQITYYPISPLNAGNQRALVESSIFGHAAAKGKNKCFY